MITNLLSLALFISGASSLIYEIVWLRFLVLIFGNTAHSTILVLSVFMAGLAFGSFLFGRVADRTRHLLRVYILIELGIALTAWLSPNLINLARTWLVYSPTLLSKFTASFVILFPVTTLIGATLPVLVKYFHQTAGHLSRQVGRLYAFNTAGAVFGTLLAGFVLIETLGLTYSLYVGIAGNLLTVFLITFWSIFIIPSGQLSLPINQPKTSFKFYSPLQITVLVIVFALSGLISLAYEVVLIRLITPSLGTFIYGFSASLAIYLFGLALGSFLYSRWLSHRPDVLTLVGWLQTLIGLSALLALVFISYFIPLWLPHPLIRLIAPLVVFLPLTLLLGAMFPAVTQVFAASHLVASRVGLVYALNSLGSIFGSLTAGFLLIPLFGSVAAVIFLAILNALFGFWLFLSETPRFNRPILGLITACLVLGVGLFSLYQSQKLLLPRYLKVAVRHHQNRWSDTRFILKEDIVASVLAITAQDRRGRKLLIDGVGTTSLSEETKILAHLPLLLHPNPQAVLIIALGMGTTYRSALSHPQAQVDAVELVPSVPRVMPYFHLDADQILSHPRGRIIVNDGRNYVFTSNKKYDVVAIDPPPPDNAAGTTILFSQEFYQDIKRILKPDGIMLGWFHYDVDVLSYRMMLQAFIQEFPHILVFRSPRNLGLYLVGSQNPLWLDQTHINQLASQPSVKADMTEWSGQVYDYDYLLSLYLGTQIDLKRFVAEVSPVTDYCPRSEYFLLRQLFYPSPLISQEIIDQSFTAAR